MLDLSVVRRPRLFVQCAVMAMLTAGGTPAFALFVNGGFENSPDFAGWTVEYGTYDFGATDPHGWSTTRPPNHPKERLIATSDGVIAQSSLDVEPYEGTVTAGINDLVGAHHATRLSQTSNLTQADRDAGCISIDWGVLLQNPPHNSDDQPFFSVELRAGSTVVASFQATADDAATPESGWTNFGNAGLPVWYRTGNFYVNVSAYAVGTPFTLTMVVSDCRLGAHGGMAFIDRIETELCSCLAAPQGMVAWWPLDQSDPLFPDLIMGNDGTARGTLPIPPTPELVHGALDFNGSDHVVYVEDPESGILDFGDSSGPDSSDFSIDAWVRTSASSGYHVIVWKLESLAGFSSQLRIAMAPRGYAFGILDDRLVLHLAGGSWWAQGQYLSSPIVGLNNGQWHFVAVTVDRDGGPGGVRFRYDGTRRDDGSLDPIDGSISNAVDLVIGAEIAAHTVAGEPIFDSHFDGGIDEVEIFRRVVTDTELDGIFRCGARGKCRNWCSVPKITSFPDGDDLVVIPVQLHNAGEVAETFTVDAIAHDAGFSFGGQSSNVAGPQTFIFFNDPNPVAAKSVSVASVAMERPEYLTTPGTRAAYTINVVDSHGLRFRCHGFLRKDGVQIGTGGPDFATVGDAAVAKTFTLVNNGSVSTSLDLHWRVEDTYGEKDRSVLGLGGLPPGRELRRRVKLAPGSQSIQVVPVTAFQHEGMRTFDIVMDTDIDGDGRFEPTGSSSVRTQPRPPGLYLNAVDRRCRDAIAKAFRKAVLAASKVSTDCHRSRNQGKLSSATDCNDLSAGQADAKGKFARATDQLLAVISASCVDAGAGAAVLELLSTCPEPCGTATEVGNPMASYAEVGTCLACLAGDIIERGHGTLLGLPGTLAIEAQTCHAAIARGFGKYGKTLLRERSGCQKEQDQEGNFVLSLCATADPDDKIASAESASAAAVRKACATVSLASLDSCSATDVESLVACLGAEQTARSQEAFTAGYELQPPP